MERLLKILKTACCCIAWLGADAGQLSFSVTADAACRDDTLVMYVWRDVLTEGQAFNTGHRYREASCRDGVFSVMMDSVTTRVRVSLGWKNAGLHGMPDLFLGLYIAEPGDAIRVDIRQRAPESGPETGVKIGSTRSVFDTFAGPGSAKYACRWMADGVAEKSVWDRMEALINASGDSPEAKLRAKLALSDSLEARSLEMVDASGGRIADPIRQLIKADIIGRYGLSGRLPRVQSVIMGMGRSNHWSPEYIADVLATYRAEIMPGRKLGIPDSILACSPHYLEYTMEKRLLDAIVDGAWDSFAGFYNTLKETAPPGLRDRLIAVYPVKRGQSAGVELDSLLREASVWLTDRFSREMLERMAKRSAGIMAYDFSLPNVEGEVVSLLDFRGKVVFLDFWYAACAPCHRYFSDVVVPVHGLFEEHQDVVFVSINLDDYDTWKKLYDQGRFTIADAVNLYTEGKRFMHPIIRHYAITAFPTPILIGRDGSLISSGGNELSMLKGLTKAIRNALEAGR